MSLARIILIITALLSLQCCAGVDQQRPLAEYELEPLEFPVLSEDDDLADMVSDIKYIPFEETDSSFLTGVNKILMTGDGGFILLDFNRLLHFSADGKFLKPIGTIGRGPGEYYAAIDICLSTDKKNLYLLDATNNILFYDIGTGKHIRTVMPRSDNFKFGDAIMPRKEGVFDVLIGNLTAMKDAEPQKLIFEFNDQGELLMNFLDREDYIIQLAVVTQNFDNRYLIKPLDSRGICYQVQADTLKPSYRFDFGKQGAPMGYIFNEAGQMDVSRLMMSHYYKTPMCIQDNEDYLVFTAPGPDGKSHHFIYSKKSDKGIHIRDLNTDLGVSSWPFYFRNSDRDYLYGLWYPGDYDKEHLKMMDPLNRYIIENYRAEGGNDNPILVGIRFKF